MRSAVLMMAVLACTAAVSEGGVVVYNDFATPASTGNVNQVGAGSTAAPLIDYNTGLATGITLTVPSNNVATRTDTGACPAVGDYQTEFGSIVNSAGLIYVGASPLVQLQLDGLSPSKLYRIAFASHRATAGNNTDFIISGADSYLNVSSAGAVQAADTGRLPSDNPTGLVAAFTNINPGSDGSVTITLKPVATWGYVNAMSLQEAVPEPATIGLLGLGSLSLMFRRRAKA